MAKQITFFQNAAFEWQLRARAKSRGLTSFGEPPEDRSNPSSYPRFIAFGYASPTNTSPWLESEFIEYSSSSAHQARLWFDPFFPDGSEKSGAIAAAYQQLAGWVRRESIFRRSEQLWVKNDLLEEFQTFTIKRQQELDELVLKNRDYAINVLGARIKKIDA